MWYGYFSELSFEIQAHIPDLVETSGRIFFVGGLHLIFRTFLVFCFPYILTLCNLVKENLVTTEQILKKKCGGKQYHFCPEV